RASTRARAARGAPPTRCPLGRRGLRKKLERVRIDVRRLGQQNRTLHHVGELAHVARPSVRTQRGPRARRQTLGGKSVVLTGESEEVLGEHRNVVATLADSG